MDIIIKLTLLPDLVQYRFKQFSNFIFVTIYTQYNFFISNIRLCQ